MSYGWHDLGDAGLPSGAGSAQQPIELPGVTVTAKRPALPRWTWFALAFVALKLFGSKG